MRSWFVALWILSVLMSAQLLAACQTRARRQRHPRAVTTETAGSATAIPTTPTPLSSVAPTHSPDSTPEPGATLPPASGTPALEEPSQGNQPVTTLLLAEPIAPSGNTRVDPSYRFGSTQGGRRDPHHGVELLNPYGTPVLAAAEGRGVLHR